ncbi:putative zinc finger protein 840 [Drosophila ficusphila]|uniref:putative zinc finger protein 840 n=1 Tax=Drosophila ficusphila TaxID=30025 RepID=UPI0007E74F0D|nr:putative zinc finger protein 840 [Drosophila ficusphila]
MSVLAYPRTNDEEIFRHCTKDCGVVTATEDFQYFALRCIFCSDKFLYFDSFIGHMQTVHLGDQSVANPASRHSYNLGEPMSLSSRNGDMPNFHEIEDLTDADTALLEPQMVIKQELQELPCSDDDVVADEDDDDRLHDSDAGEDEDEAILPESDAPVVSSKSRARKKVTKPRQVDIPSGGLIAGDGDSSLDDYGDPDHSYMDDNSGEYMDYGGFDGANHGGFGPESDFLSYDEMVEESLLGRDREVTMHIKDRKMIQFLIHSYQRNPFLWDHGNAQFRDRVKRARFLDWIVLEFKSRFNISLAKDAITRKWDNLRTVYKRECNRMALEKTNISTLWYFKELHFLNEVYSYNDKMSDAVVKETSYRRRFSAIWNDTSTAKLLSMVKRYQCFYNRFDPDYRSKERRGEGLHQMAIELQQLIDVTTIQISKRISQLRFDYSKQKMERLNSERLGKKFIANYIYYDQMHFMDDDIPPFKCPHCPEIVQTLRELDLHMLTHQPSLGGGYYCNICSIQFHNAEEFDSHKQLHLGGVAEVKFNCELCTASFREKANYEEHLRRHNEELFLPSLALNHSIMDGGPADDEIATEGEESRGSGGRRRRTGGANASKSPEGMVDDEDRMGGGGSDIAKPYGCEVCRRSFATPGHLNAHRIVHQDERERCYKCDYPQCNKSFVARNSLFEHLKQHYSNEEFKCDICGKTFKSTKNLQNHKQIHDKVKRYVCQICGSAFAQAAGLYLHKRRHNRPNGAVGAVGRSGRSSL